MAEREAPCRRSASISEIIETLDLESWDEASSTPTWRQNQSNALEDGKVLYFPRLAFALTSGERRDLYRRAPLLPVPRM